MKYFIVPVLYLAVFLYLESDWRHKLLAARKPALLTIEVSGAVLALWWAIATAPWVLPYAIGFTLIDQAINYWDRRSRAKRSRIFREKYGLSCPKD